MRKATALRRQDSMVGVLGGILRHADPEADLFVAQIPPLERLKVNANFTPMDFGKQPVN